LFKLIVELLNFRLFTVTKGVILRRVLSPYLFAAYLELSVLLGSARAECTVETLF